MYVDAHGVLAGYDFWGLDQRTYVITRFFDVVVGKIAADVFVFPKAA